MVIYSTHGRGLYAAGSGGSPHDDFEFRGRCPASTSINFHSYCKLPSSSPPLRMLDGILPLNDVTLQLPDLNRFYIPGTGAARIFVTRRAAEN
jgi:hypothetical protein